MCELIAEHPNQVPVGLGNSETAFDMTVMGASSKLNSEFVSKDGGIEDTTGLTEFAEELAHDDQSNGDDLIKPSQKRKADSASGDKSDPWAGNLTVKAPKKQ